LITEKLRGPVAAFAPIVKFAVKLVVLVTVTALTVISAPALTPVTPLIKFVPVKTTSRVCRRLPALRARLVKVGEGLLTVNVWLAEAPPPGPRLVTEKLRGPVAAFAPIVKFAVKLVALVTVTELVVISAPALTLVTSLIKFVPAKTTFKICKRLPLAGLRLVNAGTGFDAVEVMATLSKQAVLLNEPNPLNPPGSVVSLTSKRKLPST